MANEYETYAPILFHLLHAYFTKKKVDVDLSETDFRFLYKFARVHKISSLLFYALNFNETFKEEKIKKAFESLYASNLKKTILFEQEREKLYGFLNENKIAFLPLKGILMTKEYPEYGMREFADNDILFDQKYAKKVKEYFVGEGYEIESYGEGAHDTYQRKPVLNFEMHRTLFDASEENRKKRAYFDAFLRNSPIKEGYEHVLSDEQYYIYFIAHTHKHFSHGGCGVRTLVDIYLYTEHHALDREVLDNEFEKLGLLEFEKEIATLSKKAFNEEELSTEEKEMLLYVMSSGAYGTISHHVENNLKQESKAHYLWRRVFPPLSFYKNYHPVAFYSIIGIPVAWFIRLFRGVFLKRETTKQELQMVKDYKKDKD